jgi:hypothetical protein
MEHAGRCSTAARVARAPKVGRELAPRVVEEFRTAARIAGSLPLARHRGSACGGTAFVRRSGIRSRGPNQARVATRLAARYAHDVPSARRTESGDRDPGLRDLLEAALEETARDRGFDLTPAEAERFLETGELPERVEQAGRDWGSHRRAGRR